MKPLASGPNLPLAPLGHELHERIGERLAGETVVDGARDGYGAVGAPDILCSDAGAAEGLRREKRDERERRPRGHYVDGPAN